MWFAYQPTRDGRIVPCRVAESGEQVPIPGAAVMSDPLSVTLTAHPSGKFLYASTRFDRDRDGHNIASDEPRSPARPKSALSVYRVASDGRLARIQTLSVKGILGKAAMQPHGKVLFVELATDDHLLLTVRSDGTLAPPRRRPNFSALSLEGGAGLYDDGGFFFAPGGRYGYWLHRWSLLEVSGAYFQGARVAPDGALTEDGALWDVRDSVEKPRSLRQDPGPVAYSHDGKTALIQGRSGALWHCPANAVGKLLTERAIRYPIPGPLYSEFVPFYRRGDAGAWAAFAFRREENGYSLYRLPAPGRAEKTATLGSKDSGALLTTPDGHILYEALFAYDETRRRNDYRIAAYRMDDRGRVTPSAPPRPVDVIAPESIIFLER